MLTVLIANIAGAALASERITLAKDSLFSLDDLQLKLNDEIIGSITKNDNSGLTIEFNEYGKTSLEIINNLVKDLQFYAPEIIEDGTRKISLSLNDGGGSNEFGESETIITRNLNLFVGQSGTTGKDIINGSNDIEEALVGGTGVDTLVGGVGDFIDLQLEKDFFNLYTSNTLPDNYFNKVNLGIDNSDTSSDLSSIQSALNDKYGLDNSISFNFKENYNDVSGLLTIDLNAIEGISDPRAVEVLFVENINSENGVNYISETNLVKSENIDGNNILTLDIKAKAKELLVGLNSDDTKFNKNLQDILGENFDDTVGNDVLSNIISTLTSNLILRTKNSLDDVFVSPSTMQLNNSQEIDKLQNVENVKGSDDSDHIFGSNNDNILDGRSGNDILYGGAGNDKISGGEGDDIISGGAGNDYIDGGAGNDLIYVSAGSNAFETQGQTIIGGEGFDTLSFDHIKNGVLLDFVFGIGTLDEVSGKGVLGGDGIGEVIYFVLEGQTYHTFEKIIGSQVNDYIVNLTPWDHFMEIFGGQGNDQIVGSYGDELLSGGLGNDTLSGGFGVDTLSGGEGFDKFIILDDTPSESFKKQWILNNPEDEELLNSDNIFKSDDIIKDFQTGIDVIDLTAISSFNVDLSSNTDNNALTIKNKEENKFDAVMEINTENVNVSITLENFGSVNDDSEEALLSSILV